MKTNLTRRRVLTGLTVGSGSLALAGCDVLGNLGAVDRPLRETIAGANALTYRVHRTLFGNRTVAREFPASMIRQPQRPNGVTNPPDADYRALADDAFADYRLDVGGLVERPGSFALDELRAMRARTQITRHDCVEGWSCIASWTGVPLASVLARVTPKPEARFVLIRCFDTIERGLSGSFRYYETIDMVDAMHPQTILAYNMNGSALPVANGAPVRLRVERQLGYKMAKYVRSIELVASFADVEGGRGGYWEDRGYDWYAGI